MRKVFKTTMFAMLAVLAMSAAPAFADKNGHHHKQQSQSQWNNNWNHSYWQPHHSQWHPGYPKSGVSISIFSGWPSYYHSYYPQYTVVQPIYVAQPVFLQPQNVIFGQQVAYDGQFCREYQNKVFIGGYSQNSFGTACLQPDGSWKVVD